MNAILWWWLGCAVSILLLASIVGWLVNRRLTGVLIDTRGRYSLAQFQVTVWTVVVLSLIAGTFAGRWQHHIIDPLQFTIPPELLGVLGISLGSGVLATAVKSTKDLTRPLQVAASEPRRPKRVAAADPRQPAADEVIPVAWQPRFVQIFMQEEGEYADQVVDIAKFQSFVITIVLVVAYIGEVIAAVHNAHSVSAFTQLPGFAGTFLTLLGISHGAYIAGKLPPQRGEPEFSLAARTAARAAARAAFQQPVVQQPVVQQPVVQQPVVQQPVVQEPSNP